MSTDLKAKLLASRVPQGEVDLAEGVRVTVRGMTRAEILLYRSKQERLDEGPCEAWALSVVMVEPPLSESEAHEWQESAPAGDIQKVVAKSLELSGLSEGADKSGVPEV